MQAKYSVKDICIVALFSAIIFVMTVVPSIPIPLGYAHLGDAAIMLAGYYGGKKKGAIASALGSAMADFIGGYPLKSAIGLFLHLLLNIVWGEVRQSMHRSGLYVL